MATQTRFRLDAYEVPHPSSKYVNRHDTYLDMRGLIEVWQDDIKTYRKAVYQFAQYFRRESRYDFVQYEHPDSFNVYQDEFENRAFLFIGHDDNLKEHVDLAVGACCFRARRYSDIEPFWALQWVWVHPFFRRKGHLKRALPYFTKLFGDFDIEGPYSDEMHLFIKKYRPEILKPKAEWKPSKPGEIIARCDS